MECSPAVDGQCLQGPQSGIDIRNVGVFGKLCLERLGAFSSPSEGVPIGSDMSAENRP